TADSATRTPHSKFQILLSLQPLDDLLARPVMIVVQVQDDRVERQTLVAALGAAASDVLQAVEEAGGTGPDRVRLFRVARQGVGAFVRRAERARSALRRKVLAERLRWTPSRPFGDGLGELELIGARHLMHGVSRWAEAVDPSEAFASSSGILRSAV